MFFGILFFALSLRTAVTALAPLIPLIRGTYELDTFAVSLIGALAPACFAVASLTTPRITRRIGLTFAVLTSIAIALSGHIIRSVSENWIALAIGSLLALFGAGMGNVVIPPLVKKYFPDRIGIMTSLYVSLLILSATVTSLIAVPVATATNWRVALAQWGVFALMVAIPWLAVLTRDTRSTRAEQLRTGSETPVAAPTRQAPLPLLRSSTAWAIGVTFAVGAFASYAFFAWLPVILVDISHLDLAQAGAFSAIFTLVGIPPALLIPVIAQHVKRPDFILHAGTLLFLGGFVGLIFFPLVTPWLWIGILGLAPLAFPLALTLINLRTESHHTSLQLSGFAQSISYISASFAPIIVGVTYELTGGWTMALILLALVSTAGSFSAFIIRRGRTIEADLALKSYPSASK